MSSFFTTNKPFILASASPRRREMLELLGISFSIHTAAIDEEHFEGETPDTFVRRLAADKALTVASAFPGSYVLGADTVVVLDKNILGKPSDNQEAAAMLSSLSGQTHQVWTGFCIAHKTNGIARDRAICTAVTFRNLNLPLINAYVASGEPMDKAGAYGIQAMGGCLVKTINGSYSNVVGLPLAETIDALLALDIIFPTT